MNIALIIARKNSKRIPNKNKKKFCGKPIIFWPIKNSLKSKVFDKIYVSTDDKSISKLVKKYGVNVPFLRDKKLGGEKISTIKVVKDFIKKIVRKEKLKFRNLCCIYASAPFFTANDLKESLKKLKSTKADFSFIAHQIENINLRSFYFKKKRLLYLTTNIKILDHRIYRPASLMQVSFIGEILIHGLKKIQYIHQILLLLSGIKIFI